MGRGDGPVIDPQALIEEPPVGGWNGDDYDVVAKGIVVGFMMAASGSATLALIAQMLMIVFLSFFSGACPAVYSEILPTRVRYTALSIGYNIAVAVFGGFAPFIATWLIGVTGSNLAPSYYLIAAATITFLVVLRIPETAFEPLR